MRFAALLCLAALPAHAAPQCAPHDAVAAQLARQYGEQPTVMGRASDGTLMELYAGEAGTWTLTATLPDGTTCLVAAGDEYRAAPQGEKT